MSLTKNQRPRPSKTCKNISRQLNCLNIKNSRIRTVRSLTSWFQEVAVGHLKFKDSLSSSTICWSCTSSSSKNLVVTLRCAMAPSPMASARVWSWACAAASAASLSAAWRLRLGSWCFNNWNNLKLQTFLCGFRINNYNWSYDKL